MKDKIKKFLDNITLAYWIILGVIIAGCFVFYQHSDILHTGGSSINYLNGHILDFYDYNATTPLEGNAYLPTTYILFAIWNIPMRVLGFVTEGTMEVRFIVRMWYKLGTTLLYAATGIVMYKIVRCLGYDRKDSLLCSFIFYSSPIAVFSQFIFGQYDIITTFFMLLGFYYYIKKEDVKFIASFAVAMTCKYFALLVFIPLLLYREKDVIKIIVKALGMLSLFILEVLVYAKSPAFKTGVFGFNPTNFIFQASIDLVEAKVSIVIVAWVLLCAYSYFVCHENGKNDFENQIFLICSVMFITFGFSFWHPQWVLLSTPFIALAIFKNKHANIYYLLDTLLMLVYTGFTVCYYICNVDQTLFCGGILKKYSPLIGVNMQMNRLFVNTDYNLWFSMFVSVLLVMVVFSHPRFQVENKKTVASEGKVELAIRLIIGNLIFIVPSVVCLAINLKG